MCVETDYKKQDFDNLNMEGLNLFGVPLEEQTTQTKSSTDETKKILRDLINMVD